MNDKDMRDYITGAPFTYGGFMAEQHRKDREGPSNSFTYKNYPPRTVKKKI